MEVLSLLPSLQIVYHYYLVPEFLKLVCSLATLGKRLLVSCSSSLGHGIHQLNDGFLLDLQESIKCFCTILNSFFVCPYL
jgi:hypothetical protein